MERIKNAQCLYKIMPNNPPKASRRKILRKDPRRLYSWQKCRAAYLVHFPVCQRCKAHETLTQESCVSLSLHHIEMIAKAPQRILDWENLLTLCKPCHKYFDSLELDGNAEKAELEGFQIKSMWEI